ncbi:helix-turn-helix domain-containing protein [Pseudomonas sp.]|uniref:TetR/AcrR family transcriptional regulator n=1 Tax=Pseudomonas sp. TaxID=306 RepID=UPI002CE38198|nr:helix-turn-helix domain-containing protein [Pseudomonas sp.]HUE93471.1 helix-turn-helix domain-containing protein [Pseudomonas sp.]
MAKNKRHVDKEQKAEEIELAAMHLFIDVGFDASSMSMIAKSADVAPNTLYWYFKDKDDLLIAVLNRLLNAGMAQYPSMMSKPLAEQVIWLLGQLKETKGLISTVHARVKYSPDIAVWHDKFHNMIEKILTVQLTLNGVAKEKIPFVVKALTYLAEGLLSHENTQEDERGMIDWILRAT